MKKIFFLMFYVTIVLCENQNDLNDSLHEFSKKRNEPNFYRNQAVDRTKKSNMRKSTEFAQKVHDTFTFVQDFLKNSGRLSKRQVPPNPGSPGYVIAAGNCPYTTIKVTCNSQSKYRTYDGTCNNLKNPLDGSANTPYARFLSPAYDDKVNSPRTLSVKGGLLPNPRTISLNVSLSSSTQRLSKAHSSQLYAIFGQFLTHDIGATSATTDSKGMELDCPCGSTDKNCFSFSVPPNDPYLALDPCVNDGLNKDVGAANLQCNRPSTSPKFSPQTCMKMTRSSATFPGLNCSTSYREQLNLYSAYIDGSVIYGSDVTRANQLRMFTGGLLKTSTGMSGPTYLNPSTILPGEILTGRTYLPFSNDSCGQYNCFLAGEHRTSENLGLVAVQTLFNREHNRIAAALAKINPIWNDETIYQETRRIVVAQLQHISYNEFIPQLVGDNSLKPLTSGYYTGYDPTVSPQLTGEFSTAAFRMGHSLIRQVHTLVDMNQTFVAKQFQNDYFSSYFFNDSIFRSDMAYNPKTQGLNGVLLGILNDEAWKFGTFGFALQNNLFLSNVNGVPYALDLLAFNINRGREHGLQPYTAYLKKCFNVGVSNFTDLSNLLNGYLMNGANAATLSNLYKDVNDIDLYAGGLQETIVQDPLYTTGSTFGCIIMEQFARIKKSDRFWYENGPSTTSSAFTPDQLQEIRKVSLSGMICNNFDLFKVQPKAFVSILSDPNRLNLLVDCNNFVNQVDLSKWKA